MRRFLVGAGLFVAVALAVVVSLPHVADALEIQYGKPCEVFSAVSGIGYNPTESNILALPYAYTVWSKDGGDFYLLLWPDGSPSANSIYVPAGKSFTFPAPPAYAVGSNFRQKLTFHAQTDSIYLMPWAK